MLCIFYCLAVVNRTILIIIDILNGQSAVEYHTRTIPTTNLIRRITERTEVKLF